MYGNDYSTKLAGNKALQQEVLTVNTVRISWKLSYIRDFIKDKKEKSGVFRRQILGIMGTRPVPQRFLHWCRPDRGQRKLFAKREQGLE